MVEKMEKDKEGYTTKDYLEALANRVDIIENEIGKLKIDINAIEERAHNTDDEIARLDADIDAIYSGTLDDEEDNEKEIPKVGGTDSEEEDEEEGDKKEWWLSEDDEEEEEPKHHTINMNITIGADSPLNEDFFERLYDLVEKSKKKTTK